eukprot:4335667-Ditylum_brightwellii.AAC.2
MAINTIIAQQGNLTINIAKDMVHLLNYCSTHPDAVLRYSTSRMILHIHSDALYSFKTEAHSQAGGHFFLSSASEDPNKPPNAPVPLNGPIHTVCKILRTVMASATEAEIGALFINACKGEEFRLTLEEMGHSQPPTPVMTDNSTVCGILNKTIKQKRTRAIDMQFYWVHNRIVHNHFVIYWCPGSENLGDYHAKHHSAAHHKHMWQHYLHQVEALAQYARCMSPRDL